MPVLAVGGPVRVYYEEVGRRLGAEIVFPAHFDVANAVGAAAAPVSRAVTVTVSADGNGGFRVFAPDGVVLAAGGEEALAAACGAAEAAARAAALAMGAADPEVRIDVVRRLLPGASDDGGLFDATVTAVATGRPDLEGLAAVDA